MIISQILKDSNYKLTQFSQDQIWQFESGITNKENKGKDIPYCTCLVRKKVIKLTPDEAIRQLYVMVLRDDLDIRQKGWNSDMIRVNIFQNQKLAELRYWLLPRLMNGQVKVRDVVDDEMMGMAAEPLGEYKVRGKWD